MTSLSGFASADNSPLAMHRFDAPHHGTAEPVERQEPVSGPAPPYPELVLEIDPASIRAAHADDLVEFLQSWSEELDARSARLHADMATHERRERAFRLWMQNRRIELEVQLAEYQHSQARAEAAARRFAIETKP